MNRYLKLLFLIFYALLNVTTAMGDTNKNQPVFVKPLSDSAAQTIFNALPKEDKNRIEVDGNSLLSVYEADVTNSGKPQKVFVTMSPGSGSDINVVVFQQEGKKLKYLGEPPKPKNETRDGPFYFHTYRNMNTDSNEFIAKYCGKTYLSFSLTPLQHRDSFIWQNKDVKDACDIEWMRYEKQSFQTLYNERKYRAAYTKLKFYTDKCAKNIDNKNEQVFLWLLNDLSLAAHKINEPATSLDAIDSIEKHPAFARASIGLKNAVEYNKHIAEQKLDHAFEIQRPLGKNTFSWLLNKKFDEVKLDELLALTIPSGGFSQEIYETLIHGYDATISGNRYVLIGADNPTDGSAFIWVDTQNGTSVIGRGWSMASVSYPLNNVPAKARKMIAAWYQSSDPDFKSRDIRLEFLRLDEREFIKLPKSWLTSR